MSYLTAVGVLIISYFLGAIPFGLILVWLRTGKDVRQVESGRTGGTNALRAAGYWIGLLTGILDVLKSASAVWIAKWLVPGAIWLDVLAPIVAVIGHNYSIFLAERTANGRIRLRGGAGGAPTGGGLLGLYPPVFLVALIVGIIMFFIVGYASLTTLSIPIVAILSFTYLAWVGKVPWEYIVYGVITGIILLWALRPNIRRLLNGTERMVGFRARRKRDIKDESR